MTGLYHGDPPDWHGAVRTEAERILRTPEAHVLHAEGLLVSSALERLGHFYLARPHVTAAEFVGARPRAAWRALEALDEAGVLDEVGRAAPPDLVRKLVGARLVQEPAEGEAFWPSVAHFEAWSRDLDRLGCVVGPELARLAARVRQAARARALRRAAVEAIAELDRSSRDPVGGFLRASAALEAAAAGGPDEGRRATMAEASKASHADVMARAERYGRGERAPSSGSALFDLVCAGLVPGDLWELGAQPGGGKTAHLLDMARHAAYGGSGVSVFSLEMPRDQLMMRLAAAESGVFLGKVKAGAINDYDRAQLAHAYSRLYALPVLVDDTPALTVEEICARAARDAQTWARRFPGSGPLRLVCVDHLQFVAWSPGKKTELEAIGHAVKSLKALAVSLGVTVLLLSHLVRDHERRGGRPRMADFYGGRAVEGAADVAAVFVPESLDPVRTVRAHVVKSRHGGEGEYPLVFDGRTQTFGAAWDGGAGDHDR